MLSRVRLQWPQLALLGLTVLALGVRLYFGPLLRDDAYITFKYARNLSEGVGFVFNPGEPVLGTTTPLFTLILAALHRLGLSPLDGSYVLGVASDVGLVGLLGWGLGRWGRPGAGLLAAAGYALSAPLASAAVSGMETSFYLLLSWLSLHLYGQGRYSLGAVALALMALTRPDGLILAAVIGADYIIRWRRLPWASLGLFLALLAPWVAFATYYFGSPLPQSVVAKAVGAAQADPWLSLRLFGEYFTQGPMALGSLLSLVGATLSRSRPFSLLLAWFVAYALLFIGANQFSNPVFEWYYAPLLLAFYALVGRSAASLLGWATKAIPQPLGYLAIAALSGAFLLISAYLVAQRREVVAAWVDSREGGYRQVAQQLNQWAAPGEVLAAREVGVLGYYYQGPLLDLDGLVSPQTVGQTEAEAIEGGEIPWIAALSDHLSPEFTDSDWFTANYAPVVRLPILDGRELLVWHRLEPEGQPEWRPVQAIAEGITLEAYRLDPAIAWPGQNLGLSLRWRMSNPSAGEYVAFTYLVGPDGRSYGMGRSLGWILNRADLLHQPVGEWRPLTLPADAAPGVYALEVGLYRWVSEEMERAPWVDAPGRALGNTLRLEGPVVKRQPPRPGEEISPQKPLNEAFGGMVALLGFDLSPTPWRGGKVVQVTLYWQAQATLTEDYTIFVHLSDQMGHVVAQDDARPEQGQNPTNSWYNGEVVADIHPLVLPASLAPGTYGLSVGLYDARGQRLRLADGRDELSLGTVVIE